MRVLLAGEALSAASRALTVKVYEVEGDRPPMVAVVVVPETVVARAEPRWMSYAATRWLSVAAVQDSVTDEASVAVACRAPGAVGGEVSVAGSTVVTVRGRSLRRCCRGCPWPGR